MGSAPQLETIVRTTPWLMRALVAARDVDAPDWLIGAGAVRTAVWDRLHGFDEPTPPADIDVGFFDPADLSPERDRRVEDALRAALPEAPWQAKNQAAVHLWYPRKFGYAVEPLASTAEAIGTFPETAVCVGLRLDLDDRLEVVAPLGLDDLFDLVHRHNPRDGRGVRAPAGGQADRRALAPRHHRARDRDHQEGRLARGRLGCRPWTT